MTTVHISKSEIITEQHLIDARILRIGPPRTFVALDHRHLKMSNDMVDEIMNMVLKAMNSKIFRKDPKAYVDKFSKMAIVIREENGLMKMVCEILQQTLLWECMQFGDTIIYPRDLEHGGICNDDECTTSCLLELTRGNDISSFDRKVQQSAKRQFRTWTSKINAPFAL